jgi:hypothetical protein
LPVEGCFCIFILNMKNIISYLSLKQKQKLTNSGGPFCIFHFYMNSKKTWQPLKFKLVISRLAVGRTQKIRILVPGFYRACEVDHLMVGLLLCIEVHWAFGRCKSSRWEHCNRILSLGLPILSNPYPISLTNESICTACHWWILKWSGSRSV